MHTSQAFPAGSAPSCRTLRRLLASTPSCSAGRPRTSCRRTIRATTSCAARTVATPQQPVPRDVVAVMAGAPSGAPPHWAVDFWTDDADRTAEKAAELGGSVLAPPYEVPPFRQAALADPHGTAFTVSQLLL